jgi:hypothetical protein
MIPAFFSRPQNWIRHVPYEALFIKGECRSKNAFAELHRRMRITIFHMAKSSGMTNKEAVQAVMDIFLTFAPQFPGTYPELGMRRLAWVARSVLGDAFEPFLFYAHVLIYLIRDPLQQDLLRRLYETGGMISEARLAKEFGLFTEAEVAQALKRAVQSFAEVQRTLPADVLRRMTDGAYPL